MDTFKLHGSEIEKAANFEKEHLPCAREHPTTIGGAITYTFTPTGLGSIVTIQCNICKTKIDITDYDNW